MFSIEEYESLKNKYGNYSSWAIWDYKNEGDCSIIDENLHQLNSKYVFVALNISSSLRNIPWINFRAGKHDRKIKYASNDTILRGAYITDLFKDIPEINTLTLKSKINENVLTENINFFSQEMKDIKINSETVFILFGDMVYKYYLEYFKQYFENENIKYTHYSNYSLTDKDWVEGLWSKLDIEENFENTLAKYKNINF